MQRVMSDNVAKISDIHHAVPLVSQDFKLKAPILRPGIRARYHLAVWDGLFVSTNRLTCSDVNSRPFSTEVVDIEETAHAYEY